MDRYSNDGANNERYLHYRELHKFVLSVTHHAVTQKVKSVCN